MNAGPAGRTQVWWLWVGAGVIWGLLCVGVRLASLKTGHDMDDLVAKRRSLLAQVQELEREVGEARRFDRIEARASALGFVKPGPRRILIVPPESEDGFFSRLFGGEEKSGAAALPAEAAEQEDVLRVRPREEVIVDKGKLRRAGAGSSGRRRRR